MLARWCGIAEARVRKAAKAPAGTQVDVLRIEPSEQVEQRIQFELRLARHVPADLTRDNLFDSPYLLSAFFYREEFLSTFSTDKRYADPARRIIARIRAELTLEKKAEFLRLLRDTQPCRNSAALRYALRPSVALPG
jgi:hypothetical protein